jgi:cation transport regulator
MLELRGWLSPFEDKEEGSRRPPDTRSEMPYKQITQLPDSVKNNLPKHAQEIYKEAFNSAEEQYSEEDRAHRVAWSAVSSPPLVGVSVAVVAVFMTVWWLSGPPSSQGGSPKS